MRKQVFATIGCAIFLLIVVGFLMMAYSSYTKHQEEIAEQKLISRKEKNHEKHFNHQKKGNGIWTACGSMLSKLMVQKLKYQLNTMI